MSDTAALLQLVQPDVERINAFMLRDMEELSGKMDQRLIEILRYGLFGGGKRFRPLLSVVSSRLCGSSGDESIYQLATAFEYLHMATLFHDDVIDEADTRRGKASVCKAYGISSAVLAGDFLHARSMEIIGRLGGTRALQIFCGATEAMVDGEFVQLRNAECFDQSQEAYFEAIKGKTALLIAAATEIGALHGGGSEEQQHALKQYGLNLGYGFQIVDDLLDYQGDTAATGKNSGNDLNEGKMTLPLILALAQAERKEQARVLEILASIEARRQSFAEIRRFIEHHEGFARARQVAERCIAEAVDCLRTFPPSRDRELRILTGLAEYALQRKK